MADSAAAQLPGKRRRGQFDRLIASPRHPALYRLAEYGDLIEDDVMKAMDAMNAPPAAVYRHWPSTAPRGPATPGPQFAADTACRLMTALDILARHIAADTAGETAAALVYPDESVRMLPDAERVIVSVVRPPGPSGGAARHPGTVAMMINRDIGSPPYRDLTAPAAAPDRPGGAPALGVAIRRRNAPAAVIYALADYRVKLQRISVANPGGGVSPEDINNPVSAYLIAEGALAHCTIPCPRRPDDTGPSPASIIRKNINPRASIRKGVSDDGTQGFYALPEGHPRYG